eukprot:XP_001694094.1 predicted protein [Chlamydomonas reinhardtii]
MGCPGGLEGSQCVELGGCEGRAGGGLAPGKQTGCGRVVLDVHSGPGAQAGRGRVCSGAHWRKASPFGADGAGTVCVSTANLRLARPGRAWRADKQWLPGARYTVPSLLSYRHGNTAARCGVAERAVLYTLGFHLDVAHPYFSERRLIEEPPTSPFKPLVQNSWNLVNDRPSPGWEGRRTGHAFMTINELTCIADQMLSEYVSTKLKQLAAAHGHAVVKERYLRDDICGAHLGILLRLGFTDLASFLLFFARRRTAPVSTVLQADGLPAAELAQGIQGALERVLAAAHGNTGGVAGRGVVAAPAAAVRQLVAVTAAPVLVGHGAGPPPAAALVPAGNPAAKVARIYRTGPGLTAVGLLAWYKWLRVLRGAPISL